MSFVTPPTPPTRLWQLPTWLLNHVASHGNRLVAVELGRPGLRIEYAVLAGLEESGPISQAELGRRLGIDRSDIVSLLDRLERAGQVARAPDPEDRRRNSVSITADGVAALHAVDVLVDTAQMRLLQPLSPVERAQFIALLQRLLEHNDRYARPDADPG